MEKSNFLPIGDGVLRSTVITVIFMIVYAIIMSFVDIGEKINAIFYLVTTVLSIMYGSIYAVRKINKRGWLTGLMVAALYMLIIYIVSLIAGNSPGLEYRGMMRIALALAVGALSGMLGINIWYLLYFIYVLCYNQTKIAYMNGGIQMKHIRTINKSNIKDSLKKPGCKECANSCQSACKTSCTVANLACEN